MKTQARITVLVVSIAMLWSTPVWPDDEVTKADLALPAARAEILGMQDNGYSVKEVKVKSDGKDAKFTLVFSNRLPAVKGGLTLSPADVNKEVGMAKRDGGVVFTQLKGYFIGNRVYFAFVAQRVAPKGSGVRFNVFWDVPAPEYPRIVENERRVGGRIVDSSTYQSPNGEYYHTAVFHPR